MVHLNPSCALLGGILGLPWGKKRSLWSILPPTLIPRISQSIKILKVFICFFDLGGFQDKMHCCLLLCVNMASWKIDSKSFLLVKSSIWERFGGPFCPPNGTLKVGMVAQEIIKLLLAFICLFDLWGSMLVGFFGLERPSFFFLPLILLGSISEAILAHLGPS